MILSGKCKDMFDIFLFKNYDKIILVEELSGYECHCNEVTVYDIFEKLPVSFKYGVLVDFFEQEGNIFIGRENMVDYFVLILFEDGSYNEYSIPDRTEAIKKANELFNGKFK